ncbi:FAD-binding oxidoreductase [Cupriavidus basilensis]
MAAYCCQGTTFLSCHRVATHHYWVAACRMRAEQPSWLSLTRLNRVRAVDSLNATMVVEAGVTLHAARTAAEEAGALFPLRIGSEGSCQIGGNLSTNAGGTAVLRYGNMRDLVLGLEVVLPNGEIWNGLRGLRKDNAGYDLKHIFIGTEGTLGIITAAVLKMYRILGPSVSRCLVRKAPTSLLKHSVCCDSVLARTSRHSN